jgi:hypothetical protein
MYTKDMKGMEKIFTNSGCLRIEGLNTGVQNPNPRILLLSVCVTQNHYRAVLLSLCYS